MAHNESFVYFSPNSISFEQISKVTTLFYDETNQQLFTVRSGGVMGVQVQGPTPALCHSFRMQDKGPVVSLKFSLNQSVLALQRSKTCVDFFNLRDQELEETGYSQGSRYKNAEVLGFVWSAAEEIIIISNQGVELFKVFPEKRSTRALRHITVSLQWYQSCPATRLLVLVSGPTASILQPILYAQPGIIEKTPHFQIDLPVTSKKGTLQMRDMTVCQLYGQTCILVVRHPPRPPGGSPPQAQILVYTMHKTLHTVRHTHTLSLEGCGKVEINVADNLILVHHQPSRCTFVFDKGGDTDTQEPITVKPFLPGRSIRPFTAERPGHEPFQCPLYTPHWIVFQPNILIDVNFGFLWYVEIDLPMLIASVPVSANLVALLLRRKPDVTLPLLIEVLQKLCEPNRTDDRDLATIGMVFDVVNRPYRRQLTALAQPRIASPAGGLGVSSSGSAVLHKDLMPDMIVIDQSLMYQHVFSKVPEMQGSESYNGELALKVILEYIRSLTDSQIPVRDLNELLITCLLNEDHGLSRLHQLLQYRVLCDSKPLACSLISLEHVYSPALQIALDMLKRLGTADDEIMEILLHKGQVVPTLRYAVSMGLGDKLSARKFLEAAQQTGDRDVFYSVYRFFDLRNQRLRKSLGFMEGELCDSFVDHYRKLFIEPKSES